MALDLTAPFVWGSGGEQLTPAQIDAQRKVAQAMMAQGSDYSPVQSWTQGAARVAQAMFGGMMAHDANDAAKSNQDAESKLLSSLFTSDTPASSSISTAPASVAATPPMGKTSIPVSTPGKIYSNDEPSPLDPPSGADRQAMIQTILGEAGNQAPVGQQAVASVIRNRAVNGGFGGNTPQGVVQAPNQFEPWNTQAGRTRMAAAASDPAQAAQADAAIAAAYGEGGGAPADPTNGALNFIAPKAQIALGRSMPAWAQGAGQDIGDHRFFGGAPQTTQVAQADPAALPANSQPAQGFAIPGQQAAAPSVNPALMRAMASPYISDGTKKILGLVLTQQMHAAQQAADPLRNLQIQEERTKLTPFSAPETDAQGNLVQRDSLGKVTVLNPAEKAPSTVGEYKFYADQETQAGRTPLPYGQWDVARRRSGATNVNTGTIPQGYQQVQDPISGAISLQPIPGGPHDTAKQDQAKADARSISGDVVINAAKQARDALAASGLPAAGSGSSALSNMGETNAAELRRQIDVLKANASIETLNQMRQMSKTGGALGSVTEGEERLLAAKSGAIDPSAPPAKVRAAIDDYERTLLETVHGRAAGDKIFETTRQPPPAQNQIKEGATATNPRTGERVIYQNGKWMLFS